MTDDDLERARGIRERADRERTSENGYQPRPSDVEHIDEGYQPPTSAEQTRPPPNPPNQGSGGRKN